MAQKWRSLSSSHFRPKVFVKAKSEETREQEKIFIQKKSEIDGDDAKNFYEDVLKSAPKTKKSKASPKHSKPIIVNEKKFMPSVTKTSAFLAAANNDYKTVKDFLLENKNDINVRDQFGWTLLMTSSCAGAVDVTKLLIRNSARKKVKDRAGNSALSLAKRNNRQEIVELLTRTTNDTLITNKELTVQLNISFVCEVCDRRIENESEIVHKSSTLHLLKSAPAETGTIYGIPEANRGFQMMLNKGWNKNKGLGPEGTGKKFPVKTVLKRDRKGLGVEGANLARVTHFLPNDTDSVKNVCESARLNKRQEKTATLDRRRRERKRNREKVKEKFLRGELSGI